METSLAPVGHDDIRAASTSSSLGNQSALRKIRVRTIGVKKRDNVDSANGNVDSAVGHGATKTIDEDPFRTLTEDGTIIEPPFDLLTLSMLPEHSSELGQCIDAMATNIDGFGHRQKCRIKIPKADDEAAEQVPEEIKVEIQKERVFLSNFFEYATDEPFIEFRKRLRKDLETTGNGYFEVIRSAAGKIQSFHQIPSHQMRLARQGELVEYDRPVLELQLDGSVEVKKIKSYKRFRRFIQSNTHYRRNLQVVSGRKRWFKEFGDPRTLNNETGEFVKGTDAEKLKESQRANEVVHLKIYSSRSPYGLPRIIGNLLSIFGDRSAEEINFITFQNNNIPSMIVSVSNGQLTQGTIDRIEDFVESTIQGSDNYSKFLLIEAEPSEEDEGEDGGQIKIDIEPLTQTQHDDALFQNYSKNNQDKIRRSFRLPPIFVGKANDYTRATAESSRRLADEQIFAPERDSFDEVFNRLLYPAMGIRFHKFKSNTPNTTDNEQLVKILAGAEKTGGMTPRIARFVLADVLSQDFEDDWPEGFNPDMPFSLVMAEAVKNKAEASEPGQQVTALKAVKAMQGDGIPDMPSGDPVVDHLLSVRKVLENEWDSALAAAPPGSEGTGENN